MSEPRRLHRYTYADYVALEMISTGKHEFLDGEIYAMAGGSEEHSALAAAMDGAVLLQVVAGEIGGPADVGADRAAGECKTKDYTNSGKDPQGWLRRGRTEP